LTFYNEEINLRKQLKYPPFCDIILLGVSGIIEEEVQKTAEGLYQKLIKYKNEMQIYRPQPSPIDKIKSQYRWRIIIKCHLNTKIIEWIEKCIDEKNKNVKISIDSNPNNMM